MQGKSLDYIMVISSFPMSNQIEIGPMFLYALFHSLV